MKFWIYRLTALLVPAFATPMNVLFIAADDLRTDLGCYGHPLVKTPHLDALAARGMVFERAYCQQALCNPSRASLLTGRRPDRLKLWDLTTHFRETDPSIVTLPQHFKAHGYTSQGVGKIFHNWRTQTKGDPLSWSMPSIMHFDSHHSDLPLVKGELPEDFAKDPLASCMNVPDVAYRDGRVAAVAVNALRRQKKAGTPFFLAVGFWKPHLPFNAPKKYWDLYKREDIPLAPNPNPPVDAPTIALHDGGELLGRGGNRRSLDETQQRELRHGYLAAISFLDAQVGNVLTELKRLDLESTTTIVFWSDHGFHLGENGLWAKTSNFERDAKVPLIIASPNQTPGRTQNISELVDLYPTLLDLAGLPHPEGLDGESLVPVLENPAARTKHAAYTQHPRPAYYRGKPETMGVSVRTDEWRYTEWRNVESGAVDARELYHYPTDPQEMTNVIRTSSRPEMVQHLAKVFPPSRAATHPANSFDPIQYHHPGLITDLKVGLWAWPLPMDWDLDGDLDLIVNCPDVPYNGMWFFENPGGGDMPLFRPPVKVAPGMKNASVSYVDGKPRVLTPAKLFDRPELHGFTKPVQLYGKANVHWDKVRANQWKQVDYDGDGDLDLLVGTGDWSDYGWDDGFDETGTWTRGPLHGHVFLLNNQGGDSQTYSTPVLLRAGGDVIDVYGMPSPNLADFDGDGDLDLLCGEFLDGFTYFQNTGTRESPEYAAGVRLPQRMDLQMITPTAIDWDGDGDTDIICGDEDGRVAWLEHTGETDNGVPRFRDPRYFRQEAADVSFGALVTPVSVDWDGDGDEDIVCGNTAGHIALIENLDGRNPPKFAAPQLLKTNGVPIRIQAGKTGSIQGPAEAKWGYTTIAVADWDADGKLDVIANSIWGKVVWFKREAGTLSMQPAQAVEVAGDASPKKPAWTWWSPAPNELVTQWRTTPCVLDLNGDTRLDLVMLDHQGFLAFFQRLPNGQVEPGERMFRNEDGTPLQLNNKTAGKSGRRKLCFADWDQDGKLDLLLNGKNVELWQHVGKQADDWVFRRVGDLHDRRLAGHTTSPTTVDWNKDGRPDLLVGAEDGRLYYLHNDANPQLEVENAAMKVEGSGVQLANLANGNKAFSNRTYTWGGLPTWLEGWRYTQTAGGEKPVVYLQAKVATTIRIATSKQWGDTRFSGWDALDAQFHYTDTDRTLMQVYERPFKEGERMFLPQNNWTGTLLLFPPVK